MKLGQSRISSAIVTSLLVLASGFFGFQIGSPSTSELEGRIDALERENRSIGGEIQSLARFVGQENSQVASRSNAEELWVYIWIPQSAFSEMDAFDACAGSSGWELSNFGAANSVEDPFVIPDYAIYTGDYTVMEEDGKYCVREYFFPSLGKNTPLFFADWSNVSGSTLQVPTYYWKVNWTSVDWENNSLSLIVEQ